MARGIKTRPRLAEVVTCILKFADGQEVSGKIRQGDWSEDFPIVYEGAVDRLGIMHPRGRIEDLIFLFELGAKTTGATLIVCRSGDVA
jgi:hypothetical protein